MQTFYIQKNYEGREKLHLLNHINSDNLDCQVEIIDCVSQITKKPDCIIGSVEFIEKYIGPRTPEYYPKWGNEFLRREITDNYEVFNSSDGDSKERLFVKPSDQYKRFESFLETRTNFNSNYPTPFHPRVDNRAVLSTPCYFSTVVDFVDEWRYYVAHGQVVSSWWYKGSDETCEKNPNGPYLKMNIPKDFCGAIDMGMLSTGEFALVEVQHPYAIGWYGEQTDYVNYLYFLQEGFKSL